MCYYIACMVCNLPFCTQSYTNLLLYNVMWTSSVKTKKNSKSKPWRKKMMKQKSIFVAVMDENGICLWLILTHRTLVLKKTDDEHPSTNGILLAQLNVKTSVLSYTALWHQCNVFSKLSDLFPGTFFSLIYQIIWITRTPHISSVFNSSEAMWKMQSPTAPNVCLLTLPVNSLLPSYTAVPHNSHPIIFVSQ